MVTCFLALSPLGVWVSWVLVTSSLSLSAKEIDYSEVDFLTLPPPPVPYMVTGDGQVCRFHASQPSWAQYPKDVSP